MWTWTAQAGVAAALGLGMLMGWYASRRNDGRMGRIFSAAEVRALLTVPRALEAARAALEGLATGAAQQPVRQVIRLPLSPPTDFGVLAGMPAKKSL